MGWDGGSVTVKLPMKDCGSGGVTVEPLMKDWECGEVSYSGTPDERLGVGGYSGTPDERRGVGRGQLQWKDWGGGGGVTVEPLMRDWGWGEVSYSGTPDERLGVGEVSYSGTPNERLGGKKSVTVEPPMKD